MLNATRIVSLMLLACVCLCWPLWHPEMRQYGFPEAPVLLGLKGSTGIWAPMLLVAGVVLLAIFPKNKILLGSTMAWMLWLCLLDLNRLQPWVWMGLLVFLIALLDDGRTNAPLQARPLPQEDPTHPALCLLMAGIYFWSGFNKLTPYFAEDNFQWFCETFAFSRFLGQFPALGYAIALLEMGFAFGLLHPRTRRITSGLVIGFHVLTLFYLGPLGQNWNQVVLPWNAGMAALVYLLFATKKTAAAPPAAVLPAEAGAQASEADKRRASLSWMGRGLVLVLVWTAPVFHFWGLWPYTLSWELYSNTQPEMTFYAPENQHFTTKNCDQVLLRFHFENDPSKMLIDDWAMHDLGVPQFVSDANFAVPAKYLCACSSADSAGVFVLRVHRFDKSKEEIEWLPCSGF